MFYIELEVCSHRKEGMAIAPHAVCLLANICLRWTFRRCFPSSCWGKHEPFEQNFGLLISCFLGIVISRLSFFKTNKRSFRVPSMKCALFFSWQRSPFLRKVPLFQTAGIIRKVKVK